MPCQVAEAVADTSKSHFSVIGGGDSVAAVRRGGYRNSEQLRLLTGGGASLEYLASGSLPGIALLLRDA